MTEHTLIARNDWRLIDNGYEPLAAEGKRTLGDKWSTRPNTVDAIAAERAAHPQATNTGARTGRLSVIDVDLTNKDHAEAVKRLALDVLGGLPPERRGSKGMALCYRNEAPARKITVSGLHTTLTHTVNGKAMPLPGKVEILGVGQQLIIYGVHPDSGRQYEWPDADLGCEPLQMPLNALPEVTPAKLREFAGQLKALLETLGYRDVVMNDGGADDAPTKPAASSGKRLSWEGLRKRLSFIHPRFEGARPSCYPPPSRKRQAKPLPYDGNAWLSLALCLRDGNVPLLDDEPRDWLELVEEWSDGTLWRERTGERLELWDRLPWQGIAARLQGEPRTGGRRTGVGTIIDYAMDGGCQLPLDDEPSSFTLPQGQSDPSTPAPAAATNAATSIAPRGSEIDLADGFASAAKDTHRYVAEEKAWYSFDGKSWRKDTTKAVRDQIRLGVAKYAKAENDWKAGQKIASNRFISGVEAVAQADRRLAATADQWDTDAAVLCTPAGIVDLTSGNFRSAKPEDYCRKITAVAPAAPGVPFPNFKRVLANITGGDADVEAYLQKVAGYCLYGEQTEKAFFIVAGEHNSGKTTLFETLREVMGDYATSATAETFLEDPRNMARATNDLAELIGYRLVVASEPDKNRSLSAARIKRMIGRDSDRVRRLYQSGTVQKTTWKPVLHCNDVPHLGHGDDAVKSRLRIIPGGKTIPQRERDPDLPRKLKAEYPAILRWMIDGCVRWQKEGLGAPTAVTTCGEVYFKSEDPLAGWLAECACFDRSSWHKTDDLYSSYCAFADDAGAVRLHKDGFAKRLSAVRWERTDNHGNAVVENVARQKRHAGQGFIGIALKQPAAAPARSNDAADMTAAAGV
jgi:putative DNA primase/helicase